MISFNVKCANCERVMAYYPSDLLTVREIRIKYQNWLCDDCKSNWEQIKKQLTWENTFYCRKDFADKWQVHNIAFEYGYIFFVFGESVFHVQGQRLDKLEKHILVKKPLHKWATIKDIQ